MSYRNINYQIILKGTLLAMLYRFFPDEIPASVNEYAKSVNVAPSTFTRTARWLLALLPGFLRSRRPGPAPKPAPEVPLEDAREQALKKLDDLRRWLKNQAKTPKNRCYDGETEKRIAQVAEEIRATTALTYEEIARELGMDPRQLNRIRKRVAAASNSVPEKKSTRPKKSPTRLAPEIQLLILQIEASADTRNPYNATDIKRILEKNYKEQLKKYHNSPTISEETVSKYMGKHPKEVDTGTGNHPRGSYTYPEPFQVVAMDTCYFKLFGFTFYIITVFDMGGRLNLITRIFLKENTQAVLSVIKDFLSRYPGVGVFVIDRGTPYLNEDVRALIESHSMFRLVSPPNTPTVKAALERHFLTLKTYLREAVETTFPKDPNWLPEHMAKVLEVGVSVFASMYHLIPQEYIDGVSPWERGQGFDAVRAAALQIALFEHALNNEPSDQYARHFHQFFQFPWEEKKTVGALQQFSTNALRQLLEQERKNLGPPFPNTIGNPLGYLAARAREIQNKLHARFFSEKYQELDEKRKEKADAEERDKRYENPEAQIERMLGTLVKSVRNHHGVSRTIDFTRCLLSELKKTMGPYFPHEVARLRKLIPALCGDKALEERITSIFDGLTEEIMGARSP